MQQWPRTDDDAVLPHFVSSMRQIVSDISFSRQMLDLVLQAIPMRTGRTSRSRRLHTSTSTCGFRLAA